MGKILKYDSFASAALFKSLKKSFAPLEDIKVFKDLEEDRFVAVWKSKAGKYPSYGRAVYSTIELDIFENKIRENRLFAIDMFIGTEQPGVFKLSLFLKAKALFECPILPENRDIDFIQIKNIVSDFLKDKKYKNNLIDNLMNYNFTSCV